MPTQIQLRRGTAAQWTSTNPTLASGELGVETDTGKIKVGSGSTAWTGLLYSGGTPAGSTGQLQFNSSSQFAASSDLFWDSTNSRLGVGTSSPADKLDVRQAGVAARFTSTNGNANQIALSNSATAVVGFYIGSPAANVLQFSSSAGTERMRIGATGGLIVGSTIDPGSGNILVPSDGTIFGNNSSNSRSYIQLYNSSTGDMSIATTYTSAAIKFLTSGTTTPTERMRINYNGDVGIGTSSTSCKLHVYGSNPGFRVEGDGGSYYPEIRLDGVNGSMFLTTYYGATITATNATGNNTIRFRSGGTTSAGAYGGSDRMIIDSTGAVCINTSSSTLNGLTSQLAISATNSTSSPNAALNIRRSYDVHPGQTSNYYGVYSNVIGAAQSSTFTTAGVYGEASIDNGNGVIGKSGTTTSNAYGVTGWASVDSNGYGNAFALRAYLSQTGPNPGNGNLYGLFIDLPNYEGNGSVRTIGVYYKSDYTGSQTTYAMYFVRNSNNIGSISTSTTATAYNTSSDYRMKENVQPMTNALATVAQLNPVTYTWKSTGEAGQGFIAHELQAVVPHAVTGEKDAIKTERVEVSPAVSATYDEEGNELTPAVEAVFEDREVPDYQGVDTSFLVATLTAAIQELKAELDIVKSELATLKQ